MKNINITNRNKGTEKNQKILLLKWQKEKYEKNLFDFCRKVESDIGKYISLTYQ